MPVLSRKLCTPEWNDSAYILTCFSSGLYELGLLGGFALVDLCGEVVGHAGQPLHLALRKGLATCRSFERVDGFGDMFGFVLWGHVSLKLATRQSRIRADVGSVKPAIRVGA